MVGVAFICCSSLALDKSCFLAKKDSYVTACCLLPVTLESDIIQCMYFYMLVFIILNMTRFFVEKRISQLCRNR